MTAELKRVLPGQERQALRTIADRFKERLGEHADTGFAYALRAQRTDKETAQTAARVMKKLGLGQPISTDDARTLDRNGEVAAAERIVIVKTKPVTGQTGQVPQPADSFVAPGAVRGGTISDTGETPQAAEDAPLQEQFANVPAKAIEALIAEPARAQEFDTKYGKGLAERVLKTYGRK